MLVFFELTLLIYNRATETQVAFIRVAGIFMRFVAVAICAVACSNLAA